MQLAGRFVGVPTGQPKQQARGAVRVNYVWTKRERPDYEPHRISDPTYVRTFDTTLRDGEQSPGASLTSKQKLAIARQLARLGVDVIEAGFPVASPDDFEGVRLIAQEVGNSVDADGHVPVICGMARTKTQDLDRAWDAVRHALRPRVHTLIATSEIHMRYKLHMTRDQVVRTAVDAVSHLRSLGCTDIEFTCEDASRSEPAFLYEVCAEVIRAGATTLMIPDTVGFLLPTEYAALIAGVRANTPGIDNVVVSAHCHDDLGCSTSNSLAAAMAGARQIEATINGIGERAGNASLEEIVMAIALKGEDRMDGLWTGVKPVHIHPTSQMVSKYTGMPIQPNKAIVGANAFSHESGMHQDGMLKHKETYQIITPETVGITRRAGVGIVLGKHSGRHALGAHLAQLGCHLTKEEVDVVFKRFKVLADAKKVITDEDLHALVGDEMGAAPAAAWQVVDLQVVRTNGVRECTVQLKDAAGVVHTGRGKGPGPVAAAYKAIDSLIGMDPVPELMEYSVTSLTEGIEALVTTRVIVRPTGREGEITEDEDAHTRPEASASKAPRTFSGQGTDEDLIVSSAMAYVSALNKLILWREKRAAAAAAEEARWRAEYGGDDGGDGDAGTPAAGSGVLVAA